MISQIKKEGEKGDKTIALIHPTRSGGFRLQTRQAKDIPRLGIYQYQLLSLGKGILRLPQRERPKTCTILRNLGKKWTKILFAVWSQGTSYDETLHIQNLKARNVPWAMAL